MSINKVSEKDRKKIIKFYIDKPLPEKKAFFPGRMSYKWVTINKAKTLNDVGNLTEYGKDKLLEQHLKAELAYNGYEGLNEPGKDEIKEMHEIIKKDMISRGAW